MNGDPKWLSIARGDLGLVELHGAPTTPKIAGWLQDLGAWWRDDETPWCGTAVAAWLKQAGGSVPKHWYRAKGWLDWGRPLVSPVVGCVVVFERAGGGHVGLVVGRDDGSNLMVLGGNQGNRVSIMPFEQTRVLGYRWPTDLDEPPFLAALPQIVADTGVSTNEA